MKYQSSEGTEIPSLLLCALATITPAASVRRRCGPVATQQSRAEQSEAPTFFCDRPSVRLTCVRVIRASSVSPAAPSRPGLSFRLLFVACRSPPPSHKTVEQTWRHAYQKQVQETELLKREGGDTALAAQWRQRYEKLSLEKVHILLCCISRIHARSLKQWECLLVHLLFRPNSYCVLYFWCVCMCVCLCLCVCVCVCLFGCCGKTCGVEFSFSRFTVKEARVREGGMYVPYVCLRAG